PPPLKLAYLPSVSMVRLRLTAIGNNVEHLNSLMLAQVEKLLPLIKKHVYGFDDDTLEEVIGKLLEKQQKTIAIAESCTGGYMSHLITKISGCSAYYQGSVVPYHNNSKVELLGVSAATLEKYGAVSEEVVVEMAENVRVKLKASVGISASGIA